MRKLVQPLDEVGENPEDEFLKIPSQETVAGKQINKMLVLIWKKRILRRDQNGGIAPFEMFGQMRKGRRKTKKR